MHPHQITLEDAIAAHRAALTADEAAFDDNGHPIDFELVDKTGTAEMAAYKAYALAQCLTPTDVQAKIDYIINGSVGIRTTLLDCLGMEEYGGSEVQNAFIRSLLVSDQGQQR